MKLIDFCNKYFGSRAKCAEALGMSIQSLNNMICKKSEILELSDNRWILTNQKNRIISID